jgi:hypothetical protein
MGIRHVGTNPFDDIVVEDPLDGEDCFEVVSLIGRMRESLLPSLWHWPPTHFVALFSLLLSLSIPMHPFRLHNDALLQDRLLLLVERLVDAPPVRGITFCNFTRTILLDCK